MANAKQSAAKPPRKNGPVAERVQPGPLENPSKPKKQRKPTPSKRAIAYVTNRAAGMNKTQAALKAGYSANTASQAGRDIENSRAIQDQFKTAIRDEISPKDIAKVLKEGLGATKTEFFANKGIVVEERETIAFGERRAYAETAAKLGGYHVPTSAIGGANDLPPVQTEIGDALGQLFDEFDKLVDG